jgi:uncharacterized protein (TIGR02001 family)
MTSKQNAAHATALAVLATLVAGTGMLAAAARADGPSVDVTESGNGPRWSVNAGYVSDYRLRGFTQTREKSALQGGADFTWRRFHVGVWATNVDFGRVADALGRWHDAADYEIDAYVGVKPKFAGFDTDFSVTYNAYPGAFGLPQKLDYVELKAGVSRQLFPSLAADLQVYYSPDYQGETGPNWVLEGGLAHKLAIRGSIAPSLGARLGYSAGDEARGGFDYWYWNAGMSVIFADYFEFDLRYYDTFDVPAAAGSCRNLCDGRVVARITFEN